MMRSKIGMLGAALVVLAGLSGCGEGDMNPNATPNTPAPGQGPSAGGSGTKPGESDGDVHGQSGGATGTDGSSGANPTPR